MTISQLTDDELKDMAYSAYEEAMSFGLSVDTFLRYFKGICNRLATQAQGQDAAPADRTPKDYAIEHAEYMAQNGEFLINAVNDFGKAEQEVEDGTANPSDVDEARHTCNEALGALRSGIYEFRKRAARAKE